MCSRICGAVGVTDGPPIGSPGAGVGGRSVARGDRRQLASKALSVAARAGVVRVVNDYEGPGTVKESLYSLIRRRTGYY